MVRIDDAVRRPALAMDNAMKAFSRQQDDEKIRFVTVSGATSTTASGDSSGSQGDGSGAGEVQRHSPNEFHGFARVEGLKEQFMVRF